MRALPIVTQNHVVDDEGRVHARGGLADGEDCAATEGQWRELVPNPFSFARPRWAFASGPHCTEMFRCDVEDLCAFGATNEGRIERAGAELLSNRLRNFANESLYLFLAVEGGKRWARTKGRHGQFFRC